MTNDEIVKLWGKTLYKIFRKHLDSDGWLTSDWGQIIEKEIPLFDVNYNDNPNYAKTYASMYLLNYEENEDGSKIRPKL